LASMMESSLVDRQMDGRNSPTPAHTVGAAAKILVKAHDNSISFSARSQTARGKIG
jgi:hypothetical protein